MSSTISDGGLFVHAYIVFAHPTRRSYTGEVFDQLCRGLDDGGHSYEIGDLYEMDFKCELNLNEYIREMNVEGNRPTLPTYDAAISRAIDLYGDRSRITKSPGVQGAGAQWDSRGPQE